MKDSLGDRMKGYEQISRSLLMPHSYMILRVDGRAFHSYLRDSPKPFDYNFMLDMQHVGAQLCHEVSGTLLAYGQSDEISLVVSDIEPQAQPWFGGVVQKMASVAAGVATLSLIERRGIEGRPHFDARVFTVPNVFEVVNYLIWRQRDAVRNSISMVAKSKFAHKQLHGVNSNQMQEMLFSEHGINWNDYPAKAKRGWVVTRSVREADVTYTDKRTNEVHNTTAMRTFWESKRAPNFNTNMDLLVDVLKETAEENQSDGA